jgi:hypothetical protein
MRQSRTQKQSFFNNIFDYAGNLRAQKHLTAVKIRHRYAPVTDRRRKQQPTKLFLPSFAAFWRST